VSQPAWSDICRPGVAADRFPAAAIADSHPSTPGLVATVVMIHVMALAHIRCLHSHLIKARE
jgi:hypothetical protein